MQRKIHNYEEMMRDEGVVNKLCSYLEAVEKINGYEAFSMMLQGKEGGGRLFGFSESKSGNTNLEDFYPEQHKMQSDGKTRSKIKVDILGMKINECILKDLKAGVDSDAIAASIAGALDKNPRFQRLIDNITSQVPIDSQNDKGREVYRNFILGQAVFFCLSGSTNKIIDDYRNAEMITRIDQQNALEREKKSLDPNSRQFKSLQARIDVLDSEIGVHREKLEKLMAKLSTLPFKYAPGDAYNHMQGMELLQSYEIQKPAMRPQVTVRPTADNLTPPKVSADEIERRLEEGRRKLELAQKGHRGAASSASDPFPGVKHSVVAPGKSASDSATMLRGMNVGPAEARSVQQQQKGKEAAVQPKSDIASDASPQEAAKDEPQFKESKIYQDSGLSGSTDRSPTKGK